MMRCLSHTDFSEGWDGVPGVLDVSAGEERCESGSASLFFSILLHNMVQCTPLS
jgi:hypothetical protein